MHKNSELMFSAHAVNYLTDHLKVLEIGPDEFPSTYQKCSGRVGRQWDTIDLNENEQLTYTTKDPYNFPIPSDTYDAVVSGNVIEHVPRIWTWMCEIARITKPGGLVITGAPCSWPYHTAPYDCWRIYPDGMRALCEDANLRIEFVTWGSLELPEIAEAIPGRSFEEQPQPYRDLCMQLAALGNFPIEKSFDTLCVARKPTGTQKQLRQTLGTRLRKTIANPVVYRLLGSFRPLF
jgi:SAM-dependent methyltransferase